MGFTFRMFGAALRLKLQEFFSICYIEDDLRNLIMQKDGRCFDTKFKHPECVLLFMSKKFYFIVFWTFAFFSSLSSSFRHSESV